MKVYSEIGLGNETFINTEFESADGSEHREPGFKLKKISEVYLRVWIGKTVCILSTKDKLKINKKDRANIKILIGFC